MPKLPGEAQVLPIPVSRGGIVSAPQDRMSGAIAGLGQDIASGASEIHAAFEQEKARIGKLKVEDAFNKVRQKRLDLTIGDETTGGNGFTRLQSGDAVQRPILKDWTKSYDDAVSEIAASLDDEDQRQLLKQRTDIDRLAFQQDILAHVQKEEGVYQDQQLKATSSVEANIAAMKWNSPSDVLASLARVKGAVNTYADSNGITGEAKDVAYMQQASKIHRATIEQAVDSNNPEYAKLWLTTHRKEIDVDTADAMEKLIKTSGDRIVAQRGAEEIMGLGLSEQDAKREARTRYTGEQQDQVVQRLNQRYTEIEKAKNEGHDAAWEMVSKQIAAGANRDSIKDTVWNKLKGDDQIRALGLISTINNREIKPDSAKSAAIYYKLRQAAISDPVGFKREPLDAYVGIIEDTRLHELMQMQTKPEAVQLARTKTQILQQGASAAGLDPKDLTKSGSSGDKVREFYGRVEQEMTAFQTQTGKAPTDKDISDIVDRLTIKVVSDPGAWFFSGERPAVKTQIEGVPTDMIDDLAAAVKKSGQPVTDANIKKLYEYMGGK